MFVKFVKNLCKEISNYCEIQLVDTLIPQIILSISSTVFEELTVWLLVLLERSYGKTRLRGRAIM